MYTFAENLGWTGYESIGWPDHICDCRDAGERPGAADGCHDAVCFIWGNSRSRKPSTFHEIFHDSHGSAVFCGGSLGHLDRDGSAACARMVEDFDVGVQRLDAVYLHSRAADVPDHAISASGHLSQSAVDEEHVDGHENFLDAVLCVPGGTGRMVALFLQQAIDEGAISESAGRVFWPNINGGDDCARGAAAQHYINCVVSADQRVYRRAGPFGKSPGILSWIFLQGNLRVIDYVWASHRSIVDGVRVAEVEAVGAHAGDLLFPVFDFQFADHGADSGDSGALRSGHGRHGARHAGYVERAAPDALSGLVWSNFRNPAASFVALDRR